MELSDAQTKIRLRIQELSNQITIYNQKCLDLENSNIKFAKEKIQMLNNKKIQIENLLEVNKKFLLELTGFDNYVQ